MRCLKPQLTSFSPGTHRAGTGSAITAPSQSRTQVQLITPGRREQNSSKGFSLSSVAFQSFPSCPFHSMSVQFVSLAISPEPHVPLLSPGKSQLIGSCIVTEKLWMQHHYSPPSDGTKGQDKVKSEVKIKTLPHKIKPDNMGSSPATQQD